MSDRDIFPLLEAWNGRFVVVHHDRPTGTRIFIAVHDDRLGRPTGGTRMKSYPSPREALRDAQRLGAGMTQKWAALGMPFGGGKAVLDVPRPLAGDEREGLLARYGQLLASLQGAFATGPDLGTTAADMTVIGRHCQYVHGLDPETGEGIDPGPYTAHGVDAGIRAALGAVFGSLDPTGRRILVQGLGGVGAPLAASLAAAGAEVLVSDADGDKAEKLAAEIGARVVAPEEVYDTECEVFAPCAIGGILSADTIPRLLCRMVAGSANNQLGEEADAERLRERGILYVPDYVINGGGAMSFGLMSQGILDRKALMAKVGTIGDTIAEILRRAAAEGTSPVVEARRRVERALAGEPPAEG